MELIKARMIAERLVDDLKPYCERIEIAGSIRRKKADVGDIEICCIPKILWDEDLVGNSVPQYVETDRAVDEWLMNGRRLIKNGSRFKQIEIQDGFNLDLFLVYPPAQWGVIFALRTGPAEYSRWLVTLRNKGGALPSNYRCKNGGIIPDGLTAPIPMDDEGELFYLLGLDWCEPEYRRPLTTQELLTQNAKIYGY
jgi:DNA polymerase/3'-5' exonuclease PolX